MKRWRALLIGAICALALLSGSLAFAYWYFLVRGPLAGETTHDFGVVPMAESQVKLHHTFHLYNRLREPVTILAVKPECGCVVADMEPVTLEPGEPFDLPVTLTLSDPAKTVLLRVVFDGDHGVQMLKLRAAGHYLPQLRAVSDVIGVEPGRVTMLPVHAAMYNTTNPPSDLRITAAPGLEVRFDGWTQRSQSRDPARIPPIWETKLHVRQTVESLPEDAELVLEIDDAKPLRIAVHEGVPESGGIGPLPVNPRPSLPLLRNSVPGNGEREHAVELPPEP